MILEVLTSCRMMKIFEVVTILSDTRVVLVAMAESFEGSFSLDEFEASVLENVAAIPNLDNITVCSCRGFCLREKGRNYCLCKSANNFCSSACHEGDVGSCMNNRQVQESDSDETVSHEICILNLT